MQMSATGHSSRVSMVFTASLASFSTGSGVFAVATCTGGVSGGSTCGESGKAASTIDLGGSEAAVVSAAVPVTNSATAAASALATALLPDAVACGASTTSAVRDGDGWSSIDTAPVFSMPTEPTPVSEATTQPARPTVPHKAVVTCANRREFMIPSPPPEPCTAKHATRLIFGSK